MGIGIVGSGAMRQRSKQSIVGVAVAAVVWFSAVVITSGQGGPAPAAPPMAEQVFKNVQVLKGIPVNEFMGTMGIFSAALGMSCEDCHAAGDAELVGVRHRQPAKADGPGDDHDDGHHQQDAFPRSPGRDLLHLPSRQRAPAGDRRSGRALRHAAVRRSRMPSSSRRVNAPKADEILDKYIQAIGGAQRVAALKSYVAKGIERRVRTGERAAAARDLLPRRVSARRSCRTTAGDSTTTYDGRSGWIAAPFRPVDVLALSPQEVDGLKLEADLAHPAGIKQALTNWRVGLATVIDDREVQVVQGTTARGGTATLYFDAETGLLVRHVRYNDSPGRPYLQADRLLRLSRGGRGEDAVQVDRHVAGRARRRRAHRRAAERRQSTRRDSRGRQRRSRRRRSNRQ